MPRSASRSELDNGATVRIEGIAYPNYPAIASAYVEMVVSGEVDACKLVILSCKRFQRMMRMAETEGNEFYFCVESAIEACAFIESLSHIKGDIANQPFIMEPWQIFKTVAIFGFRWSESGYRVVTTVYLEEPRKHGKSLWAAAVGLYLTTVEGGVGDDCYIIAPKFDQGLKVLEPFQKMAAANPALVERFGIKSTKTMSVVKATDSNVIVLAALGEKQDGHDPKIVIADEFHAVPPDIYKVMKSAGRAREEKMFLIIGSAGRHTFGTGWDEHRSAVDLLEGKTGDRFHYFALIYTLDPEDIPNWYTEKAIRKANPGLGISVSVRGILQEANDARTKPIEKVEFYRTALNLWGHSESVLFPKEKWDRCARPGMTLDMMKGRRGWIGLDLASRNDMVAAVALFEEQTGTLSNTDAGLVPDVDLSAFAWHFAPETGVWREDEDLIAPYQNWNSEGFLRFTPGSRHRYNELRGLVFRLLDEFNIEMVVIDDQQANEFFNALLDAGKPVQAFRKNAGNFSDPTKDLISRITGEELSFFHTGNPVLGWNMQNVIGGYDTADRILGKKPAPNSNQKIDGFDCLVMANAARLQMIEVEPKRQVSASVRNGMRGI